MSEPGDGHDDDELAAVVLDRDRSLHHRALAARALWRRRSGRAVILSQPDVDVVTTAAVCDSVEFEEAWDAVGALFCVSPALRDAWLATRHAGHPSLLDVLLPLTDRDPFAMALVGASENGRVVDEVSGVFGRCWLLRGVALYDGLISDVLGPRQRRLPRTHSWDLAVDRQVPQQRRALAVHALVAMRPRVMACDQRAIDTALGRLQPR